MRLVAITLAVLLAGCATYRPPAAPVGQEAQATRCNALAKADADRLPGERRAALAKARGSSVPLEVALGVVRLLTDPVSAAAFVVLGPPALVVGAVQAKKTYAADYQASYEACMMSSPDTATFTLPEQDAHWMVRR